MQSLKKIKLTTKRGYLLDVFEGDSITREMQKKGEYDSNTLNSLSDVLTSIQPHVSLDVGANVGNHSVLIAKLSAKLIAFEPVKFVFEALQKNLLQNNLVNALAVNFGLSNEESHTQIFIPENGNLGSSSLENRVGKGTRIEIQTVVGDVYLKANLPDAQIDFIKMDVEGHEAMALLGLEHTIRANQPLLLLEWKCRSTADAFINLGLFNKLFSDYQFYSLTYTNNKKVHAKNVVGFLMRIYYKIFNQHWCLSNFDPAKSYTNVYFVPVRYSSLFKQFKFLSR